MQNNASDKNIKSDKKSTVLELTVNNHPGVMSHICMLFARRAFNVEKILCLPKENQEQSRIWLTVNEKHPLDQVIKQVLKLEDVLEVRDAGASVFEEIDKIAG